MKKTITLVLLFFVLIFNKAVNAQSKSIYVHDFHITESNNLTSSEQAQIDKAVANIKEYLKATLKGDYTILPEKAENMLTTELRGMEVNYRYDADYIIFGTTVYSRDEKYLIVSTDLYEVLNRDYLKQRKTHTSEGTLSMWNIRESRLEKIEEILKNVFPNTKNPQGGEEDDEQQVEEDLIAERDRIAKQKEEDRIQRQKEEDEKRKQIAAQKEIDRIQEEKDRIEEIKRAAAQEKRERIKAEKREKRRRSAPAAGTMTAGAIMGGIGVYWRLQALGLYDEYKTDVNDDLGIPILDEGLETARKPNRRAHIIGAGGILVGGVGLYMWTRRKRKKAPYSDTTSTHFQKVRIEPHIDYNAHSNTNTVHAKMTYTF